MKIELPVSANEGTSPTLNFSFTHKEVMVGRPNIKEVFRGSSWWPFLPCVLAHFLKTRCSLCKLDIMEHTRPAHYIERVFSMCDRIFQWL
jgi:hypothetical protein